jgi:hypothetical protein
MCWHCISEASQLGSPVSHSKLQYKLILAIYNTVSFDCLSPCVHHNFWSLGQQFQQLYFSRKKMSNPEKDLEMYKTMVRLFIRKISMDEKPLELLCILDLTPEMCQMS